jgi:excinuclease ABC subunit C
MFLLGKQHEVNKRLTLSMEEASSRLAFEQAAVFRDQIQSLRQVQEKQFVSSSKGEDVDIVVALQAAGQLCVNIAMVRGGRHLGDRPLFPSNAGESSASDAIAAFIHQHYAAHPAPARLLVLPFPTEEEKGEAEISLAQLAGRHVPILEAYSVVNKAWVDMALQNAQLAILARNQATAQQEQRLAALQEALQLPEAIAADRMLRHQSHSGRSDRRILRGLRGKRHEKGDYRRFNIRDIQPGDDYAAMRQAVSRRYDSLAPGRGLLPT